MKEKSCLDCVNFDECSKEAYPACPDFERRGSIKN